MNRKKWNDRNMNNHVVGKDEVETESVVIYTSQSRDIIEEFTFPMNSDGYWEFMEKIPSETRIVFEA